jgi:hypothetical protein
MWELNILSTSAALTLGERLRVFIKNFPMAVEAGASPFCRWLLELHRGTASRATYDHLGDVVAHTLEHAQDVLDGLFQGADVGHHRG